MPTWLFWTLATLVSWGVWATCPRLIDAGLSPAQSQAVSTLGVLPVLGALMAMRVEQVPGGDPSRGMLLALGSGLLSSLGNVACYEAMRHARAATVVPLIALAPVVTVALAAPILHERLSVRQWAGAAMSLVAIYLFSVPQGGAVAGDDGGAGWLALPLLAVLLFGVTGLLQKAATNHVSARGAALGFLLAFLPLAGALLLVDPVVGPVSARSWFWALVMGFSLAFGNLTLLLAFATGGKASLIAPLAGLYPIVSIPIALVGFGERIGAREGAGVALALASVVLLSLAPEPTGALPPSQPPEPAP